MLNNAAVERGYVAQLERMTREMVDTVSKEVKRVMARPEVEGTFGQDDALDDIAEILENLTRRFTKEFDSRAEGVAKENLDKADKASAVKIKTGIMAELGEKFTLKRIDAAAPIGQLLKAQILESTGLIKSIAAKFMEEVRTATLVSLTSGTGLHSLVPALAKLNGGAIKRARNIAKDQTRKAYNNLNAARMQGAGVRAFEWIHSSGSNQPRPLHLNTLNGKIFRFDDLPIIDERTGERGIPGQLPNCGCTMRPVFIFDDDEKEGEK